MRNFSQVSYWRKCDKFVTKMNLPVSKVLGVPTIDFVILGGGISGLASAFYLRRFVRKNGKDPRVSQYENHKVYALRNS